MSAPPADLSALDDAVQPLPPTRTSRRGWASRADDGPLMPPYVGQRRRHAVVTAPARAPVRAQPPQPPVASDPEQAHAEAVAARLERLAADLRRFGFRALLETGPDRDRLDVLLAAILAGYLARP